MASLNSRESFPGPGRMHERKDSSLLGHAVQERLPGTREEEEEKEENHSAPDFTKQLRDILGDAASEYFLHPPPLDFHVSPSLRNILDGMEDPLGAEELWRILQERSKQKLKEDYGEPMRPEEINILQSLARRPAMREVARRRHRLTFLRKLLEHQQDLTDMFLMENPFPDKTRRPARPFLTQKPEDQPHSRGIVSKMCDIIREKH